jgi:hypothetical protein
MRDPTEQVRAAPSTGCGRRSWRRTGCDSGCSPRSVRPTCSWLLALAERRLLQDRTIPVEADGRVVEGHIAAGALPAAERTTARAAVVAAKLEESRAAGEPERARLALAHLTGVPLGAATGGCRGAARLSARREQGATRALDAGSSSTHGLRVQTLGRQRLRARCPVRAPFRSSPTRQARSDQLAHALLVCRQGGKCI